ncbi:hypothetical protein D3C87_790690 [compost metagenome]
MGSKNYDYLLDDIKKIPVDKALKILHDNRIIVNEEELDEILEFLYLLARITLKEFLT